MAISPDDTDKPFVARWNSLVSALLIEPSIKLVARQACDYGFMDGEDIFPGNERLARQTGYDERTVRQAWHFMRAVGMAERVELSAWTGGRRTADRYGLAIPADWRSYPILGPHAGRFTCQQCGKLFNPQACNTYMRQKTDYGNFVPTVGKDGLRDVRWALWKAVFCPAPRGGNGCQYYWERANGPWGAKAARCWEMFHRARNDDWPMSFPAAALPDLRSGTGSEIRQHPETRSGTPGNQIRQVPDLTSAQGCNRTLHVKVESQRRRASQATHDRRLASSLLLRCGLTPRHYGYPDHGQEEPHRESPHRVPLPVPDGPADGSRGQRHHDHPGLHCPTSPSCSRRLDAVRAEAVGGETEP